MMIARFTNFLEFILHVSVNVKLHSSVFVTLWTHYRKSTKKDFCDLRCSKEIDDFEMITKHLVVTIAYCKWVLYVNDYNFILEFGSPPHTQNLIITSSKNYGESLTLFLFILEAYTWPEMKLGAFVSECLSIKHRKFIVFSFPFFFQDDLYRISYKWLVLFSWRTK